MKINGAEVYPVGMLQSILRLWGVLTNPKLQMSRRDRLGWIPKILGTQYRYLRFQIRAKNWHAVKNNFNGYLAEHDGHPHNCGSGWTKRRALRDVDQLCSEAWMSGRM